MKILPNARTSDIVVQHLNGEVLIYDLMTDKAFCLNETSGIVFNACDGKTSFDELKRRRKFSDEIIFLALDELKKENLLAENVEYDSPFAGISRREAIKKVGLASMIALPLIIGITAPTAANAASQSAVTCPAAAVGSLCACGDGDNNSCGQGRIQCPTNCTCFLPAGFGTCTSALCEGSCG